MNVQHLDRVHHHHESGVETQRLCPWPVLNAPFEGSWFVVRAGTASDPDRHPDHELWIAVRGEATIDVDGERRRFADGDILYLPPHAAHRVINDGDRDFEMYGVWWDPDLARRFTDRHERETAPTPAGALRPEGAAS